MKYIRQKDLKKIVVFREYRTDLKVQFRQNEQAKLLGARFDWERKSWFIPKNFNISPFYHWLGDADSQEVYDRAIQEGYVFGRYENLSNYESASKFLSDNVWSKPPSAMSSLSSHKDTDSKILQPLENFQDAWVYVTNANVLDRKSIIGKWILFANIDGDYDALWCDVVNEIRAGRWEGLAKCSTLLGGRRESFLSQTKPIIVYFSEKGKYQKDIEDFASKYGIVPRWKLDADTIAGIYS